MIMRLSALVCVALLAMVQPVRASGLMDALQQSAAGMRVQGDRMKVISQNIANAESTGDGPGAEPYRRKVIRFKDRIDKENGITKVTVDSVNEDRRTPFNKRYDPSHPAANEDGYVLYPNISIPLETMDMQEAQRSYEANLSAVETTRNLYLRTIDLLR